MASSKRTVLITGCSDGGMGAELAKEFHAKGLHVLATARDACAKQVSHLDILINNAEVQMLMPIADMDLSAAKRVFDANLWGGIAMVQTFLPLLMKSSNPIIANHTSIGAALAMPFQAPYNASKAALAMFTETLRMELGPFNVKVVELRTGAVKTKMLAGQRGGDATLPPNSILRSRERSGRVGVADGVAWRDGDFGGGVGKRGGGKFASGDAAGDCMEGRERGDSMVVVFVSQSVVGSDDEEDDGTGQNRGHSEGGMR